MSNNKREVLSNKINKTMDELNELMQEFVDDVTNKGKIAIEDTNYQEIIESWVSFDCDLIDNLLDYRKGW